MERKWAFFRNHRFDGFTRNVLKQLSKFLLWVWEAPLKEKWKRLLWERSWRNWKNCSRTTVSAVSVVNACKITDPEPDSLQFQQDCKVRVERNIYSGKVAAIGKCYAIILCPLAYYVYFYVRRHKLWSFNVAIVLAGSEEEMKRLANGYETGN